MEPLEILSESQSEMTPEELSPESVTPEEHSPESVLALLSKVNPPLASVLFREEHIQQIFDFFQQAILNPSSPKPALYIYGPSGSGKSHCINHLIQHWMNLGDALKNLNHQLHIVPINFSYDLVQPNDIYKKIGGSQCRTSEQFYEFLKREKGKNMRIIIAENLDRCLDNNWQDLLVELCHLATCGSFLLVGLGRKMLDVEFNGGHQIDVIAFPSYEREELTEILQQNIQGREMIFESNALRLLEENFQNNHGYLRVLEPICTLAIEKAKDLQKNQVELVDMRSALTVLIRRLSHDGAIRVKYHQVACCSCIYNTDQCQASKYLFSQMLLSFSASKLLDLSIISKSDPMVVVYLKKRDGKLEELGRTEVILNNLNPVWIQKVSVAFQFETVQNLIFRVYDVDAKYHKVPVKTLNLRDQEFLGEGSCFLSEIVTKQNQSLTLTLKGKNGHGGLRNIATLTVHAEETFASRNAVEIKFRCAHLDNKDLFSKSDPFLRISRTVEIGGFIPICKTEVVDNNLNPTWKPLCLSMQQFGSKDTPLVVECFDFNSNGNHVLIGKLQKSVADFEKLVKERSGVNFFIPSSGTGHEKVLKGQLFVDQFCEKEQFSFIDYISSGFELNFMVAVDFTGSNGDPRKPESLHYVDPYGRLNSYQQAIIEVGQVIQFYDADKSFPAWGFGGRMADGTVSHCFNLNGNASESEVFGVEGIMAAYASALHNVALSGPTVFGQVVNKAAEIATRTLSSNNNKYYVLLIITDGILIDLQETKDALVRASNLPLSILIVGVGNADFKQMEILEADNGQRLESSTGCIATRDNVQFVPMRDAQSGQISVVQGLLEELPGQFLSYMRSMDIKPLTFCAGAQASSA